jgi:serine/threonine-protein phosphatase 2A regulatory subunit B
MPTSTLLLSANDKTIKLWKISEHRKYKLRAVDLYQSTQRIELPEYDPEATQLEALHAINKHNFTNAHAYHINSLAMNNIDNEMFYSSDDLRVNCWRFDRDETAYSKLIRKNDSFLFVLMLILI